MCERGGHRPPSVHREPLRGPVTARSFTMNLSRSVAGCRIRSGMIKPAMCFERVAKEGWPSECVCDIRFATKTEVSGLVDFVACLPCCLAWTASHQNCWTSWRASTRARRRGPTSRRSWQMWRRVATADLLRGRHAETNGLMNLGIRKAGRVEYPAEREQSLPRCICICLSMLRTRGSAKQSAYSLQWYLREAIANLLVKYDVKLPKRVRP